MRIPIYLFPLLLAGCMHPSTPPGEKKQTDSMPVAKPVPVLAIATPRPDLHVKTETINLPIDKENDDTYEGKTFNTLIDYFPTLYQFPPVSPDSSYALSGVWKDIKDSSGEIKHLSFGSEAGQDGYYVIYAWFLNKKLSRAARNRAEKLTEIYRMINNIFGRLEHGGTGFGHTYKRITGISAYDGYIYDYTKLKPSYYFEADKNTFINTLKKYITKRADADIRIRETDEKTKKQILSQATALSHLFTTRYYLLKAKEFTQSYVQLD
jgi:hypothetical protein